MSCVITYKGNKYTQEQFKEYISSNKNEFSHIIASNENVIDSFKRKMEGIDYVFSQSPELASIGSKAQYLQYLSTIFKTSKVKDIVYHGTDADFLKFDKSFYQSGADYIYFGKLDTPGFKNLTRVIPAILNLKNPSSFIDNKINKVYNEDGFIEDYTPKFMETASEEGEFLNQYGVKEPEQIHILSSKKDLEMFRNFINFTKSEYAKYGDIQQFRDYIMSKNFAAIEEFLVVNNKIDRKC